MICWLMYEVNISLNKLELTIKHVRDTFNQVRMDLLSLNIL